MEEDPQPEPPRRHAPPPKLSPVFLQDEPRPILGAAIGPRCQERTLVCAVHAPSCEMSEFCQFLLAGQAQLKSWREDGEAIQRSPIGERGLNPDDRASAALPVSPGTPRPSSPSVHFAAGPNHKRAPLVLRRIASTAGHNIRAIIPVTPRSKARTRASAAPIPAMTRTTG